nr:MAG TPA: hypothetical protein [Caudoviricetes sp.]
MCYSLTVILLSPFSEGDFYLEFNFELPEYYLHSFLLSSRLIVNVLIIPLPLSLL